MGLFQNPIWSNNLFLLQGYPNMCSLDGTCMRDVKDMGQQMGYLSLQWNWPKEEMNIPIWAGIVDGARLIKNLVNSQQLVVHIFPLLLFHFSPGL